MREWVCDTVATSTHSAVNHLIITTINVPLEEWYGSRAILVVEYARKKDLKFKTRHVRHIAWWPSLWTQTYTIKCITSNRNCIEYHGYLCFFLHCVFVVILFLLFFLLCDPPMLKAICTELSFGRPRARHVSLTVWMRLTMPQPQT